MDNGKTIIDHEKPIIDDGKSLMYNGKPITDDEQPIIDNGNQ